MKKTTLLILLTVYLALNAVIVAIGISLPPWQPDSTASFEGKKTPTPDTAQTSTAGLATLDAKVASGTAQPSVQELPVDESTDFGYPLLADSNQSDEPTNIGQPDSQASWEGFWFVSFEQEDGSYSSGELTNTISNTTVTARGIIGGTNYEFEGELINDGELVLGTWTNFTESGTFTWSMLTETEFLGRWDTDFGFCGARPGVSQPDPCYLSPSSVPDI